MAIPLHTLTVDAFGRGLRAGEFTSSDVTLACLQRVEADNGRLNAFTLVLAEEARAQALQADRDLASGIDRGPLHGVPISIKDLLDLRATPTSASSRVREGHVARGDAQAIVQLRRAGAVFVGKTNLHEFAFGTTTEESAFGASRNPHDVTRSAGGSSGGSAISVATGMALATIGTDTGGSIRIPASACGIVGLKPAAGEVSTDGVVPLSRSLDHVGPLARSVTDAWLVYRALRGDTGDATLDVPGLEGLRFAVPRRYFLDLVDEDVRSRFEESLERFRAAGATVVDADIPHADDIVAVYATIVSSEASAYHARTLETMPERYTPPVRARLEVGRYLLAEDYLRALKGREVLRREVAQAVGSCDALVLPTLPIAAPTLGQQTAAIGGSTEPVRSLMLRLTSIFNLSGHAALSLPCGRTSTGLPVGLQVVGASTKRLAEIGLACEQLLGSA